MSDPHRNPFEEPDFQRQRAEYVGTFTPRKDAEVAASVLAALDVNAPWLAAILLRINWAKLEPTTRALLRGRLAGAAVGTPWPFTRGQMVRVMQLRDDGGPRQLLRELAVPVAAQIQAEQPGYSLRQLHTAVQKRLGRRIGLTYLRQFIEDGHLQPTPEMARRRGEHKQR
jgi:hypothetical protein